MPRIIRGRTLSFLRPPADGDDWDAFVYEPDGALVIDGGKIIASGRFDDVKDDGQIIDFRDKLILPGFIDPHIHFPQTEVIAAYAAALLDWLNDHTFPAEGRFADPAHAVAMANHFFDTLLRHGTTTVSAFCSSHAASVDAFFAGAEARNMAVFGGKTMMDRNAPDAVCDTAETAHEASAALIARWHGRGRGQYVITPRFAITSSPEQLEVAGALAASHPDCLIQTHMSENRAEIALTADLFPAARDYLDVYEHFGLIGAGTLLGHCIHLTEREVARMAESGAVAVHCPTSNLFLGSGLFDRARLEAAGVRTALATDIGGGTSFSMLRTIDEAYKIQQLRGHRWHPFQAFYEATLGNAAVLGAEDRIGTLAAGTDADLVVLDPRATPEMALRADRIDGLADELFLLQTLGDDRAVVETFVAGQAMKGNQG